MTKTSLVSHIRKLALSWTVAAILLTLTLSGSLFFVLVSKDAEREIQTLALTTLASYRTDILSGDIRSIELQLNKEFSIGRDERLLFLDQNKKPWVSDLRENKIDLCNDKNGICRKIFEEKVYLDQPIYFDNEKTNLWGYIHIEKSPQANWPLIFSVTLAIILGMSFQALGFYYNLLKSIKSVSLAIENWAQRLSADPKNSSSLDHAPFSEIEPIERALAGLRQEIDILENTAREQGALNTLRGVGHDILNPVSRLKRLLGLLEIKMSISASFDKELFQNCTSNLKRLSGYAEQLKVLYKKNAGENQLIDIPVLDISKELRLLTHEIALDPEAIHKNIGFQSEILDGCFSKIPAPMFGRLLENIVGNSIHASKHNSQIKISSSTSDEKVVLTIADSGEGISDEIRSKIFEPNFSTKANKGTGLGLFVVKQICEQYQCQISVNSKLNIGTTFQITFPKSEINL
jgi:signal transduction histidine kinase